MHSEKKVKTVGMEVEVSGELWSWALDAEQNPVLSIEPWLLIVS
jgi:hypothetical protein